MDTDINIKRIIENQEDITTYTKSINHMKNAEKLSNVSGKQLYPVTSNELGIISIPLSFYLFIKNKKIDDEKNSK